MDQSATFDEVWSVIEQMRSSTPILDLKYHAAPSMFLAENMLREARRQKNLQTMSIPEICILDPDGDLLGRLREMGRTALCTAWACYHTKMYEFEEGDTRFGIIGCAVGAAFSVLLAEQRIRVGMRLADQPFIGGTDYRIRARTLFYSC